MRSQVDGVGLLVAVLAVAVALTLLPGPFAWLGSICGLLLTFTMLAYDREGYRTVFESLAFAAVFALAVTLAAAIPLRIVAVSQGRGQGFEGTLANQWLPLLWLGVTILFWPVDRARMSGRVQSGADLSLSSVPRLKREVTIEQPSPVRQVEQTVPLRAADVTPSRPTWQEEPVSLLHTTPVAAPPQPQPVPIPAGPETTIFVSLVGEGLNVLRGVQAEHLGRDFYKIVEPMPEGETWQYGPGQVVRCKKKTLSGGKSLVAIEEAPRAR